MISPWLRAFALTTGVEATVAIPLLRGVEPAVSRRLTLVVFANLMSHPAVWFVFPALAGSYLTKTLLSEAWAVSVEAAFFCFVLPRASRARLWGVSMIANGLSWLVGIVVQTTTHWIG